MATYTGGTTSTINVDSEKTTGVYIGKRPEIIIAERADYNSITKDKMTIPAGNYYVIMAGGGGAGSWDNQMITTWKKGGGSGAGYVAYIKLNQRNQFKMQVGAAGDSHDVNGRRKWIRNIFSK